MNSSGFHSLISFVPNLFLFLPFSAVSHTMEDILWFVLSWQGAYFGFQDEYLSTLYQLLRRTEGGNDLYSVSHVQLITTRIDLYRTTTTRTTRQGAAPVLCNDYSPRRREVLQYLRNWIMAQQELLI